MEAAPQRRRCWGCARWLGAACLYLLADGLVQNTGLYSRFTEMPFECEHPALAANHSGVRVLVAGFAKTGTRTVTRALWELGLEHAYHSEEFAHFVWAPHADRFWLDYHGGWFGRTPGPFQTALGQLDRYVLDHTSPEKLASITSKCRVDAIAFDGLEHLIWPMYQVSPDAKVLMMDWRTFPEWRKSLETFRAGLFAQMWLGSVLSSPLTILPWGALFKHVDPLLFDRRLEMTLKTGGPPFCQAYSTYFSLWHAQVQARRIAPRWFSGLVDQPEDRESYEELFRQVEARVPRERLMRVNPMKHTYEDICRFLELEDCRRKGRFEKPVNLFNFERDFPDVAWKRCPIFLANCGINFFILRGLWRLARAACSARSRRGGTRGKTD